MLKILFVLLVILILNGIFFVLKDFIYKYKFKRLVENRLKKKIKFNDIK